MVTRIINNNVWSPVPWGWNSHRHHHCCNNNNGFSKMIGWAMMLNMVDNMFNRNSYMMPAQQSWYPYVNLNNTYADTLETNNSLKGVTDMYGKHFNVSQIGEKYYAVSKDCKIQISGETPEELLENIGKYINDNPDAFEGKTENPGKLEVVYGDNKPTTPTDTAPTNTTPTDGTPTDGTPADGAGDPPAAGGTQHGRKSPAGWYPAKADGQDKMHFTKDSIEKAKGKDSAALYVAKQVISSKGTKFAWVDADKLAKEIIAKNPSVFKDDGSIKSDANFDNLDLPSAKALQESKEQLKKDETVSDKKQKACSDPSSKIAEKKTVSMPNDTEKEQLIWNDSGNYITSTNAYPKTAKGYVDSDAILHIGTKDFNINCGSNTADFCSLIGTSSCFINNYKLINEKGHFDPNNKREYYLTDTSGKKTGHTMKAEEHDGKKYFVLICGENRFSMDDIMAGNVPWENVNDKADNEYALWRNK